MLPVRRSAVLLILPIAALLGSAGAAAPQSASAGPTPAEQRLAWYEQHARMAEESPFRNLKWQFVGPTNVSGRIADVAPVGSRGESYTIFIAGASGGVWRTRNEGVTWEPVFEHGPSTSVGDVTIAPSDPSIVYIGTGEANIFRSSMAGAGILKSTDGGDTWEHKGLAATHTIPRIVVHPTDPDVVYVAASGHEWTDNPERGVYKSTDGGDTWEQVLYVDERTGAIDLVIDPSDPETLYAATWERVRRKWNDPRVEPGFDGSGIHKSTDGGASWTPINEGLPDAGHRGRIGIDISRSNPRVLYAFIDNYEVARMPEEGDTDAYGRPRAPIIKGASVYRSDDAGASWHRTSEENEYMEGLGGTYGWVFGQIRVDPVNEDKIYVMGLALNVSEDRGKTFRRLTGMHGDHHGLWIDPENPNYLVNTNDGGVDISYDGGENWRNFNDNLPIVQFFNIAHDMDDPFHVYGSVQDHGSFRGVVDLSRGRHNIPAQEFERALGGEGSNHAIDPTDPNTVYAAGFYGRLQRQDLESGEVAQIVPQAEEGEMPLRGQWLAPFILSPHNPRIVYLGMNKLFRSLDRGDTWEAISPDLTFNEVDKIGDIPYQTIYSISESPKKFGLVYVGTDDGRVWATENAGFGGWSEITGELPQGKVIAEIVASRYDVDTVFLVQNGKRDDDFRSYIWKSTDRGTTWQDLAGAIPSGPVNVVKEDPKNPDVLYAGTDHSAYVSVDGGASWHVLAGGLPTTFVADVVIHPERDVMVAGTHGRGVWAIDVRPLQALTPEVMAKPLALLEFEGASLPGGPGGGGFFFGGGGLPRASAVYWMAQAGDAEAVIEDADGNVIKTLEATGDRGINVVQWDLSSDAAGGPRRRFGPNIAAPGTYTLRIRAAGQEITAQIELSR